MSRTDWHLPDDLIASYAAGTGTPLVDEAVEAHLMRCGACRRQVTPMVAPDDRAGLEDVWQGIHEAVVSPAGGRVVRALRGLGVPESDIVVVRASSGLHRPWLVAVGGALVAAILSGTLAVTNGRHLDDLAFLVVAPLIPVLAVAASFDGLDPIRELSVATPLSKTKVALLRTLSALVVAIPVTTAVGLLVPGLGRIAVLWLLPGLALCALVLVLLSWFPAWAAATGVMSPWFVVAAVVSHDGAAVGAAALASPAAQLIAAAAVVAGSLAVVARATPARPLGGAR